MEITDIEKNSEIKTILFKQVFVDKIKYLAENSKSSVTDLAQLFNNREISVFRHWIKKDCEICLVTIFTLCIVLDITPNDLLGFSEVKNVIFGH